MQFSAFDALHGYSTMLAGLQDQPEPRRLLSEEAAEALSVKLASLQKGDRILVRYYDSRIKRYKNICGEIREVDFVFRTLRIGRFVLSFSAIEALKIHGRGGNCGNL